MIHHVLTKYPVSSAIWYCSDHILCINFAASDISSQVL